jgi:hypothetical protein
VIQTACRTFLFLILATVAFSQCISGRVLDRQSSEALAYVNIGVLNGNHGTVSNEEGIFRLDLQGVEEAAKIRFSYIGYESVDTLVGPLDSLETRIINIELEPILLEMDEVLVFPREYKEKIKGNPKPADFIRAGFMDDSLGYEVGIRIKIRKRPTLIKTLYLHGLIMSYDSVFYRLNVYELEDGIPGKNVLKKPIYISLSKDDITEDISIDLTQHHIVVHDDFAITLEFVKDQGEGFLTFSAGIMNGITFVRKTSHGKWMGNPIGVGMSVLIRYPK